MSQRCWKKGASFPILAGLRRSRLAFNGFGEECGGGFALVYAEADVEGVGLGEVRTTEAKDGLVVIAEDGGNLHRLVGDFDKPGYCDANGMLDEMVATNHKAQDMTLRRCLFKGKNLRELRSIYGRNLFGRGLLNDVA